MALLFFDSFDLPYVSFYWNLASTGLEWVWIAGAAWQESGYGRRSTTALMTAGSFPNSYYARLSGFGDLSSMIIGFAVKNNITDAVVDGGGQGFLVVLNSSNAVQFVLNIGTDGSIDVLDSVAGSVLASSDPGVFKWQIYQYFEVKFTCDGTDTIEVKIDETSVFSASGLNLRQSGAGGADGFKLSGVDQAPTSRTIYDDLYVCDTSGGSLNDFLGDVKVSAFLPTGDGDYTDFTPSSGTTHWNLVDDMTVTNYVQSSTVGHNDSYTYTPVGDIPHIIAASIDTCAKNADTNLIGGTPFWRIGTTDYPGTEFTRQDTIVRDRQIWLANPDTELDWTLEDLEDAQTGIEFSSGS